MIVLDANYFIRYLTRPQTAQDRAMLEHVRTLFRLARAGQAMFTTSEAIIAEVVFILHAPKHYNASRADVSGRLKQLLRLRGCRLPNVSRIERALDLWTGTPAISFVDALTATLALDLGTDLGTFDRRLARVPGVTIWQPPAPAADATETRNGTT